jgi:hypothetical protein
MPKVMTSIFSLQVKSPFIASRPQNSGRTAPKQGTDPDQFSALAGTTGSTTLEG